MLLLIPFDRKIEKNRLPIVTVLLVLVNCIIYFGFQGDDDKYADKAFDYYFESELPEIEIPIYIDYVQKYDVQTYYDIQEYNKEYDNYSYPEGYKKELEEYKKQLEKYKKYFIVRQIQTDSTFLHQLKTGEISVGLAEDEWKKQRGEFEGLWDKSVGRKYGFTPEKHEPITFISHQFLHGSFSHLLGNMIFLFILGFALEAVFGSIKIFFIYLAAGIGAVSFYYFMNPHSSTALVGASGAISGLMGLYAAIFGLRKIRFFYNILFYFDYVKAPALIMLPIWIANEVFQNLTSDYSNVAYNAHIGGLIAGGAIGGVFKLINKGVDEDYLDENENLEEYNQMLESGNKCLSRLEFERAKRIYYQMLDKFEVTLDVLKRIYRIEVSPKGTKEGYQKIISLLFNYIPQNEEEVSDVYKIFVEHLQKEGDVDLAEEMYVKMVIVFANHKYFDAAEKIILYTAKNEANQRYLPLAMLTLGEKLIIKDKNKAIKYLNYLVKNYGETDESQQARKLVEEISG